MSSVCVAMLLLLSVGNVSARGNGLLRQSMRPDIVANTLVEVQENWRSEAAAVAECSDGTTNSSTLDGACSEAERRYEKSCSTIVASVIAASSGNRRSVSEYMGDVCSQKSLVGWHQSSCVELANAIEAPMTDDNYDNRNGIDTVRICRSYWTGFAAEERQRVAEERAAREAAEKKAAEERAAAEKKAEEERVAAEKKAEEERIVAAKKAEEERLADEKKAEEERIEAEKNAAEAKRKADELAAKQKAAEVAQRAVEAKQKADEASANLAKKRAEAEQMAAEHERLKEESKRLKDEAEHAARDASPLNQSANASSSSSTNTTVPAFAPGKLMGNAALIQKKVSLKYRKHPLDAGDSATIATLTEAVNKFEKDLESTETDETKAKATDQANDDKASQAARGVKDAIAARHAAYKAKCEELQRNIDQTKASIRGLIRGTGSYLLQSGTASKVSQGGSPYDDDSSDPYVHGDSWASSDSSNSGDYSARQFLTNDDAREGSDFSHDSDDGSAAEIARNHALAAQASFGSEDTPEIDG